MSYQKKAALPSRPKTEGRDEQSGKLKRHSKATPNTPVSDSKAAILKTAARRQRQNTIHLTPPKPQAFIPKIMNEQPGKFKSPRETPSPRRGKCITAGSNGMKDRRSTASHCKKSAIQHVMPKKHSLSQVKQQSSLYTVQEYAISQPHKIAPTLHPRKSLQTSSYLTVLEENSAISNAEKSSNLKEMEFKLNWKKASAAKERNETSKHPMQSTGNYNLSPINGKDIMNKTARVKAALDVAEGDILSFLNKAPLHLGQENDREIEHKNWKKASVAKKRDEASKYPRQSTENCNLSPINGKDRMNKTTTEKSTFDVAEGDILTFSNNAHLHLGQERYHEIKHKNWKMESAAKERGETSKQPRQSNENYSSSSINGKDRMNKTTTEKSTFDVAEGDILTFSNNAHLHLGQERYHEIKHKNWKMESAAKERGETSKQPRQSNENYSSSSINGKDRMNKTTTEKSTFDVAEGDILTFSNNAHLHLGQERYHEIKHKNWKMESAAKERGETSKQPRQSNENYYSSSIDGKDRMTKTTTEKSTLDVAEGDTLTFFNNAPLHLGEEKQREINHKTRRRSQTRTKSKVNRQFTITIDKEEFEETMRVLKSMKGITQIEELPPFHSLESRATPIEFKEINLPVISCQLVEEKKMVAAPQSKTACKDETKSCKTLLQVPSKGRRIGQCSRSSESSVSECSSDDSLSSETGRKRRSAVCSAASSSEMEEERRFLRVLYKMF